MDINNLIGNPGPSVGVAGDWHGDRIWAISALRHFHQEGIRAVLHLGDFGVWPGTYGRTFLEQVERALEALDMVLLVTPGNHEDYDQIDSWAPVASMGGSVTPREGSRIIVLSRGHRWQWAGHTFLSLGGGATIDRSRRKAGESWWPQEEITDADVARAVAGGRADVMLCHDTPTGVSILGSHRDSLPLHLELLADASRAQVKRVTDVAQPSLLMHGHYHTFLDSEVDFRVNGEWEHYTTRTICLSNEWTAGNLALLDVGTLEVTLLDGQVTLTL